VIKVSVGLESAYLGSAERLESMMLINGYGHVKESHADEIGSHECQGLLFSKDHPRIRVSSW
jgi:hypothetical protein